jgi:hypothetical protein
VIDEASLLNPLGEADTNYQIEKFSGGLPLTFTSELLATGSISKRASTGRVALLPTTSKVYPGSKEHNRFVTIIGTRFYILLTANSRLLLIYFHRILSVVDYSKAASILHFRRRTKSSV